MAATLVAVVGLLWRSPSPRTEAAGRWAVTPLIGVGIVAGFLRLPFSAINPGYPAGDAIFFALAALAALLAAGVIYFSAGTRPRRARAAACFAVLVAVHVMMGLWYLTLGNRDAITDVHLVQQLGCAALLRGENPFAMTFPDIYGGRAGTYAPGIVVDGRVQSGFSYPPLPLLMALPGSFPGDVRYAHLGAIALSAVLIAYAPRWRGRRASGAAVAAMPAATMPAAFGPAVILLFMPTVFYQVRGAWIEPFLLLLACAAVFLAMRGRLTAAAAALGLFAVAKQYAPFALAATPLLATVPRRRWLALAAVAIIAGAVVTLPLALWNLRAFLHSQTALFVGVVRADSISLAPLIARVTGWRPTLLWPALAAGAAAAVVLLAIPKSRRGPSAFIAAAAVILLGAFLFSTQAFANYYFLAAGMLLSAAASCCGNAASGER